MVDVKGRVIFLFIIGLVLLTIFFTVGPFSLTTERITTSEGCYIDRSTVDNFNCNNKDQCINYLVNTEGVPSTGEFSDLQCQNNQCVIEIEVCDTI